ncbi:MAG: nucleotidyltransferase domain-containing protein [Planctomycetes bacterium]|nr:nucleotidyltransferase domain-containing protein [Planctomycetota bacterium]
MHPDPETLREWVRRVTEAVQPVRILLFGSAARGEMRPDSDLDILVVVEEGADRRGTAKRVYRHRIGFSCAVDEVVATEADLARYGDNFSLVLYPATREGKEIHVRPPAPSR